MKIPRVLDALLHTFLIINQSTMAKKRTPTSAHLMMRPVGKGKSWLWLASQPSGSGPRSAVLCSPEPRSTDPMSPASLPGPPRLCPQPAQPHCLPHAGPTRPQAQSRSCSFWFAQSSQQPGISHRPLICGEHLGGISLTNPYNAPFYQ